MSTDHAACDGRGCKTCGDQTWAQGHEAGKRTGATNERERIVSWLLALDAGEGLGLRTAEVRQTTETVQNVLSEVNPVIGAGATWRDVLADLERHDPTIEGEMRLDPGIRRFVLILRAHGIETDQSCQGGPGHACADPLVRFSGNAYEGFKAFAIAMTYGLPVLDVSHQWSVSDGCLHGPQWVMRFRTTDPEVTLREPGAVFASGEAASA